jgi:hypothetical protein
MSYTSKVYNNTGDDLVIDTGATFTIGGTAVTATGAEINQVAKSSTKVGVAAGSTKTLTSANNNQTINLDTLTGSVVTLPAASGSGVKFKFLVTVLATSASHKIQVANASDFMIGMITTMSDDPATVKAFAAANSGTVSTNSDTITLNRSTTGSVVVGEWLEVEDVAANTWAVRGLTASTGTEASAFSAAV